MPDKNGTEKRIATIKPEDVPSRALFKLSEVACLFSVPRRRVYSWVSDGSLYAEKCVGSIRVPRSAILEFLKKDQKEWVNKNRKTLNVRITRSLRGILRRIITRGGEKSASTGALLGCSTGELLSHLERRFEPGMTWENYGRGGWHIDHIIPLAQFDLTNPEHQRICFHFTNLQPLWEKENIQKGKKITRRSVAKYFENFHNIS